MESEKNNTVFNIASITTISGIILYQLGWLYWRFFFKRFNIDSSLIDMSFVKIIATTWTNILVILFLVLLASFKEIAKRTVTINDALITFTLSSSFMIYSFLDHTTSKLVVVGITMSIVLFFLFKKNHFEISKKIFMYFTLVVIYIISFFYYPARAIVDADKLYVNFSEDVCFILKDGNTKINGKFISHMESKYFVLVENKNCDKEVRILNDDDIFTVELNEKKGIFDDIIDQIPKVGAPHPSKGP